MSDKEEPTLRELFNESHDWLAGPENPANYPAWSSEACTCPLGHHGIHESKCIFVTGAAEAALTERWGE